jgi:hypothetical protein
LEKTESGYRFQVPLVQKYIEQVIEEEEWASAHERQRLHVDGSFLQKTE